MLFNYIENRAKLRKQRGIFLDTTENNTQARDFYKAMEMSEAYHMPQLF